MQTVWKEEVSRNGGSWLWRVLPWNLIEKVADVPVWWLDSFWSDLSRGTLNWRTTSLFFSLWEINLIWWLMCFVLQSCYKHACTHEFTGASRIRKHKNASFCKSGKVNKALSDLPVTKVRGVKPARNTATHSFSLYLQGTLCSELLSSSSSLGHHHLWDRDGQQSETVDSLPREKCTWCVHLTSSSLSWLFQKC